MKKAIAIIMIALAASCTIKNDIDYPLVPGNITDFSVKGQLRVEISEANRTVHVELPESALASNLEIERLSLSDGARCEELAVGDIIDLSSPVTVHVRTYQDYVWTIFATTRVASEIEVNAWAHHAVFSADAKGAQVPGMFQWRRSDSSEWTDGGEISAQADRFVYDAEGLEAGTDYYVRLTLAGSSSSEILFTTEAESQVANMNFDEWCQEPYNSSGSKLSWYPAPDMSVGRVWDSANMGVLTLSSTCSTTPESQFVAVEGDGKQAARMESMYPSFLGVGRFAAGNLLTGDFIERVLSPSLGARMYWGTPFTTRPSTLKGYYAYLPKEIDHDDIGKHPDLIGQTDEMQILVMLGDWDEPFEVNTATETFIDQQNDPHIIGYGKLETSQATYAEGENPKYVPFEVKIEYRDTERKPKYVIINSCASRYGDDFTGAVGSVLYVDEFEFVY